MQHEDYLRRSIQDVLPWLKRRHQRTVLIRQEALDLTRAASRMGATALTLQSELEAVHNLDAHPNLQRIIREMIELMGLATEHITEGTITQKSSHYTKVQQVIEKGTLKLQELDKTDSLLSDHSLRWSLRHIHFLCEAMLFYSGETLQLLSRMVRKRRDKPVVSLPSPEKWLRQQWRTVLLQLQPSSLLMRHSLRVALMTTIGLSVYYALDLPRGYWIVLTIMILLQPEFGTTVEKTRDRLLGTLLGVLLGSALLMASFHYAALMVTVAINCFLFVYLQPKNYKLAVVFVTVMLVALLEVSEHISWHIAAYRLLATIIGGALSIGASYLLWPRWESLQFPELMANALRANKNYLLQLSHELRFQSGFHDRVIADRRKAEVENLNVQDAVKRLQLEPGWLRAKVKNIRQLAELNKRLTHELTSFAAFLPSIQLRTDLPEVYDLITTGALVLDKLADSVKNNTLLEDDTPFDVSLATIERKIAAVRTHTTAFLNWSGEEEWSSIELLYSEVIRIAGGIKAMVKLPSDTQEMVSP